MYEKYKERGFAVLTVAMDPQGAEVVAPYRERHRLTFPHLLDPDRLVAFTYGVRATPTNLILDRQGRVVILSLGYRDFGSPDAMALIEALLAEPMVEGKRESRRAGSSPDG